MISNQFRKSITQPWITTTIEELCRRITSGGTPSRRYPELFSGDIPWVKTQELMDCWIDDTDEHISEEAVRSSSAKLLPENTILMAMYGATVGQLGILRRPMTCNQAACALVVDEDRAHFRFLYYVLLHHRQRFKSLAVGAAQQNLSGTAIRRFEIQYPPLAEQHAIAEVLGALDDKIELNRRMNATLEELARTIFRSWFVDFDPVHAKAEGRAPFGMDAATAALFPDTFEPSEFGDIPAGWSARPLSGTASFLNGLALQKYPAGTGPTLPAIKIAQLRAMSIASADRVAADVPEKYHVNDGDLIFSWSGSLLVRWWTAGKGALNQHLFKVLPADLPPWFVYEWIAEHLAKFQQIAADKATTMGHIQRRHLDEAMVAIPDAPVMGVASSTIDPLINKLILNDLESRTLAELRDTLLPKLLSGEITVRQAEQEVVTAT